MTQPINLRHLQSNTSSSEESTVNQIPQRRAMSSNSNPSNMPKIIVGIVLSAIVVIAGIFGVSYMMNSQYSKIENKDSYKAVFLTNGQVYFGKITKQNKEEVSLEQIYYLQINQSLQAQNDKDKTNNNSAQPELSLIKLGKELHGPEDKMRISRQQILFTEDLQDDSKVVAAIKKDQKK